MLVNVTQHLHSFMASLRDIIFANFVKKQSTQNIKQMLTLDDYIVRFQDMNMYLYHKMALLELGVKQYKLIL